MKSLARLLCLAALGSALSVRAQVSFTFTDLGTLPGGTASSAFGINNAGTVVGGSTTTSSATPFYAYSYSGGTMTNLGTISGGNSEAHAINASGVIVGNSGLTGSTHAFSYNGSFTDLGTLGGTASNANGINASGVVVGQSQTTGNAALHAFSYNGTLTDLGTLGGTNSNAWDINSSGVIVGQSQIASGVTRAYVLSSGTLSAGNSIGAISGATSASMALAINDAGIVVGQSQTSGGPAFHAFSYNGSFTDLGTLGGSNSVARDINANNYIVGTSEITIGQPATHAFLYAAGTMYDLNNIVTGASGWTLAEAISINDLNQIVGIAVDGSGNKHAFMLAAVPEPATYAALAGLAALGFAALRRRRVGAI